MDKLTTLFADIYRELDHDLPACMRQDMKRTDPDELREEYPFAAMLCLRFILKREDMMEAYRESDYPTPFAMAMALMHGYWVYLNIGHTASTLRR